MQVIICPFGCFFCCFSSTRLFVFFPFIVFLFFVVLVVAGFVTVSFHCLLLHFNHLLGALCLRAETAGGRRRAAGGGSSRRRFTRKRANSRLRQGSWQTGRPRRGHGRGPRPIRAAHFVFIGAAATGSLGPNKFKARSKPEMFSMYLLCYVCAM